MSSLGVNTAPSISYFARKTPTLGQYVLKIHANINNLIPALNVHKLSKFLRLFRKFGWKNKTVTSDFRLEVEIWPFHACAMKNEKYAI